MTASAQRLRKKSVIGRQGDSPGQAHPEAVVPLDRLANKLGRRGRHWGRAFAGAGARIAPSRQAP